ncbi:MAG: acylneuraminate cytidylyltransferase family protein [Prevotella sp.]|jgi:CMP-N-acetylneuraminic acid synthetase|nr:acylneuraminate cytidylyltransferase family protein [Prevotella sp.]
MENHNILAIIPARGGSKGLPNKNIKPLLGKPLIAYAIEALNSSKYPMDIVISTDSKVISEVGNKFGVTSVMRPPELATDTSLVIDTVKYTINYLKKTGKTYNVLLLIEPTNPLRNNEDIDDALDFFFNTSSFDAVATFSKLKQPITRLWNIKNNIPTTLFSDADPFNRRQDQKYGYYINGLVYAFKISNLEDNDYQSFFNAKFGAVITNKKVIDIDDEYDFFIAEQLLKHKNKF